MFWTNVSYIGISSAPLLYFLLALSYSPVKKYLTIKNVLLLAILPIFTFIVVLSNPVHNWYYTEVNINALNNIAIYGHGFWFWLHTAYSYVLLLSGLILFSKSFFHFPPYYKSQIVILIGAAIFPFIGNIMYVFNLNPIPGMEWTPIAFSISGFLFMIGIIKYRLVDIIPVARRKLVETMKEGLLVLDKDNNIVDLNPAMESVFELYAKDIIGKHTDVAFQKWPDFLHGIQDESTKNAISFDNLHYELLITELVNKKNYPSGRMILLRDITEQKEAELALSISENQFREMFEFAPISYYRVSNDGIILTANQAALQLTGYSENELIGKSVSNLYESESKEKVQKLFKTWLQTGHLQDEELKVVTKNGDIRTVLLNVNAVKDDVGTITHSLSTHQDITDHLFIKESLSIETSRAQTYLDIAGVIILVLNRDQTVDLINIKGCETLGLPENEILGKSWFNNFVPENESNLLSKRFNQIISGKIKPSEYFENSVITKHGEKRLIAWHTTLLRDLNGVITHSLSSGEDITDRKRDEDDLKNYNKRIIAINEASQLLTKSLDLNKTLDTCVSIAKDMFNADGVTIWQMDNFGYELNPIKHVGDYSEQIMSITLKVGEGFTGHVAETRKAQIANRVDLNDIAKQVPGTPSEPESLMGAPLLSDNKVVGVMTLNKLSKLEFDESDLVFYENLAKIISIAMKNARLFEEAKQSDNLKSIFLANMSHEIRTPLNSIIGYTELIEDKVSEFLDPEGLEFFQTIRTSNERLLRTIHGILDISQLDSSNFSLMKESIDLRLLLESIINEYQIHIERNNLFLKSISKISDATIYADKYCIEQALGNLFDNAIKYTSKGGITVSLEEENEKYVLKISDTGIGMSESYQAKLFETFSQESTGYTKEYQGIGLGLALTKRYLDLNNVDISVVSEKENGSTFTLEFLPHIE